MPDGKKIYLDYASFSPVDERVVHAMLPYFREKFGNPSSVHAFGRSAMRALEEARENLGKLINCRKEEIFFTSCATESNNLALLGAALANRERETTSSPRI